MPNTGIAIASAKIAYQIFKEIFGSDRFTRLSTVHGARVQRLLWAETSTKNPDYGDVKYVDALIGTETVDTAPMETIDAYRDDGAPKARLEDHASKPTGYWSNCRNSILISTMSPANWKKKASRSSASRSTS